MGSRAGQGLQPQHEFSAISSLLDFAGYRAAVRVAGGLGKTTGAYVDDGAAPLTRCHPQGDKTAHAQTNRGMKAWRFRGSDEPAILH